MNERITDSLRELKALLERDPRIKRLDSLEKRILADKEVIEASKKMNDLERKYSEILSYRRSDSEEAVKAQKALYMAKRALDSLPLVQEYNAAFIMVRDYYLALDDILFSPFRHKSLSAKAR